MAGRGRGRARSTEAGKLPGPTGRGSGLQSIASPSSTPSAGGRGRARTAPAPGSSPAAPAPESRPPAPAPESRPAAPAPESRPAAPAPESRPPAPAPESRPPAPAPESRAPVPAPTVVESSSASAPAAEKKMTESKASGLNLEALKAELPLALYKRPQRGMNGREIKLQSNLYEVKLSGGTWYKYDVEISTKDDLQFELAGAAKAKLKDRIQSRHLNRVVIDELFRRHNEHFEDHWPSYDGRKTLICSKRFLDDHTYTVDLEQNERGRKKTFVVSLRLVQEIDVSKVMAFYNRLQCDLDLNILQAGNIVIDSALGKSFVAVNRSYYPSIPSLIGNPSLSGGKELRSGIYTSLKFAEWGPLLLVDKSNTAFYKSCDLIQYISEFLDDRDKRFIRNGFTRDQKMSLTRDLRRLTVKLKHSQRGRSVKISGLSEEAASRIEFERENSTTTVAAYFNERYRDVYGTLMYPDLPCVIVVRGTKTDYYPLEVCEVKQNQPFRRKLNPIQTANMIKCCQEKPVDRIKQSIENVRTVIRTGAAVLSQHGLTISDKPVETVGRQINSPMIVAKTEKFRPVDGRWQQRIFHDGAKLDQWCVIDCAGVQNLSNKLADLIYRNAQRMELRDVAKALDIIQGTHMNLNEIFNIVRRMHNIKKGPMLAVFILGSAPLMYSQIKLLSETSEQFQGIITQCVKGENIRNPKKFSDAFVGNLLKKINVKLGGINNSIDKSSVPERLQREPYIVIGADVNHPAPGDCMTPSIAAVVGSLDYIPSKYWTEIRVQTTENNNRVEYILELKEMVKEILRQHRGATRAIPKHIYYIRDGVSEGQFETVRWMEINALRSACKELTADYQPTITVLIAQKRHHVRFNVLNPRDGCGRAGNVPPGTYIDSKVVHPQHFDFYMYTHQGLLGTSRPTHYHLIHSDDSTFKTDEITGIINHLCYVYARTSSAVSIPAPIYYAHLAAARAKEHVKGNLELAGSDTQSVSSSGEIPKPMLDQYQKTCNVDMRFRRFLYYA